MNDDLRTFIGVVAIIILMTGAFSAGAWVALWDADLVAEMQPPQQSQLTTAPADKAIRAALRPDEKLLVWDGQVYWCQDLVGVDPEDDNDGTVIERRFPVEEHYNGDWRLVPNGN